MSRKSSSTPPKVASDGTVTLKPATAPAPTSSPASKTSAAEVPAKVDNPDLIKKAEFIDSVVARCGVKKRDAKPSVEAALAVLADHLKAGKTLNLPPLGKLKVVKAKDVGAGAQVITLKLRTMKDNAGATSLDPMAAKD